MNAFAIYLSPYKVRLRCAMGAVANNRSAFIEGTLQNIQRVFMCNVRLPRAYEVPVVDPLLVILIWILEFKYEFFSKAIFVTLIFLEGRQINFIIGLVGIWNKTNSDVAMLQPIVHLRVEALNINWYEIIVEKYYSAGSLRIPKLRMVSKI